MHLALIAPPTPTVPPGTLGDVVMVHHLADHLAARGHHVTLIGGGLEVPRGGYVVADTGVDGNRVEQETADALHAERAGVILARLAVDLVADHSRAGYLPDAGRRVLFGVRTVYDYDPARLAASGTAGLPQHVGLVAVSYHANAVAGPDAPGAWLGVVHPGIPFDEYPLSVEHDGPVVYIGPLEPDHGVEAAIRAAHQAGLPITVAGVRSSALARVHAEVMLRPLLRLGDVLVESTTPEERRDLLWSACCLVAPDHRPDPFSLVAVEAMALGAPVVGFEGTVLAEQVAHGVTGQVTARRGDLAQAIVAAAKLDPAVVREGAAWAYDLPRMVDGYETLFAQLLRGRR